MCDDLPNYYALYIATYLPLTPELARLRGAADHMFGTEKVCSRLIAGFLAKLRTVTEVPMKQEETKSELLLLRNCRSILTKF